MFIVFKSNLLSLGSLRSAKVFYFFKVEIIMSSFKCNIRVLLLLVKGSSNYQMESEFESAEHLPAFLELYVLELVPLKFLVESFRVEVRKSLVV